MNSIIESIWTLLGDNAAETIALCALLLTVYQFIATRKHNRLMVTPHLCLSTNTSQSDSEYEFEALIKNNGIGPAIIKAFKLYINDKELSVPEIDDLRFKIQDLLQRTINGFSFIVFNIDYVVSEKDEELFLYFSIPIKLNTNVNEFKDQLNKIDLYIEYQSMYGQTYTFDSRIQRKKLGM